MPLFLAKVVKHVLHQRRIREAYGRCQVSLLMTALMLNASCSNDVDRELLLAVEGGQTQEVEQLLPQKKEPH